GVPWLQYRERGVLGLSAVRWPRVATWLVPGGRAAGRATRDDPSEALPTREETTVRSGRRHPGGRARQYAVQAGLRSVPGQAEGRRCPNDLARGQPCALQAHDVHG